MNFLITGLGSMGKRRIRCLKALGYSSIFGFDLREDRRQEATEKHGIVCFGEIEQALAASRADALIISVPPDAHHIYMRLALARKIPFFVEASVLDTGLDEIKAEVRRVGVVAAPSATLMFHPAIQDISRILHSGALGKVSSILFHSGQYLPDWHTYERVSDYYVSNPATGGAREIVPFELTWFTRLFGFPQSVSGQVRKTINIVGAERIDDTYNVLMDYGSFLAVMTVDVVSRCATRRLLINGDRRQLVWDWGRQCVELYDPEKGEWETRPYKMSGAAAGYNANIGENMYIEELRAFIDAVAGGEPFVNSLESDHRVLRLLYEIERSSKLSTHVASQA
jgi:predicted dehydrogenase